MLISDGNTVIGMQTRTENDGLALKYFVGEEGTHLNDFIYLLKNASPLKLMLFAKQMTVNINKDLAVDLFRYILAESNPHNLFWFANFAKINLDKLLDKCNATQYSNIPVEESFIRTLVENIDPDSNYSAILKNLVKLGVNLNQQYIDGSTILHFIANCNCHNNAVQEGLLRALIDNGADPNITDAHGASVLKFSKSMEMANYLVQQPECIIGYTNRNHSVTVNKSNFNSSRIHKYCLQNGGIEVAISRIESELLTSVTSAARTPKTNKPASFRI